MSARNPRQLSFHEANMTDNNTPNYPPSGEPN